MDTEIIPSEQVTDSARALAALELAVAEIRCYAAVGDDERAHGREDEVRVAALRLIAEYRLIGQDAVTAAEIALSTENIAFGRYCS